MIAETELVQNSFAGKCKSFFNKHGKRVELKMKALKKGLDEESIETIDIFYQYCLMISENKRRYDKIRYPDSQMADQRTIVKDIEEVNNKYEKPSGLTRWAGDQFFEFHFGLRFVPEDIRKEAARGKDVLDCGAYDGDSAVMFRHFYKPARIFSFEPDKANYRLLMETIERNGFDNVIAVKKGIARSKGTAYFSSGGFGSKIADHGNKIETTDIDSFVFENNVNPGIIKMDIEGAESEALEGAWRTINKFRPVLLISIYHSLDDFFEIKPKLEKKLRGYRMIIRKAERNHPTHETMLIAYPKKRES